MKGTPIPAALRERDQWVLWRLESRDGRPTKVPYRVDGRGRASSTDPATWMDFETAQRAASSTGDGIGFVFAADDPFFGVDLDHCVAGEDIDPHADAIVSDLNSYTEVSPSGTGLHIIAKGSLNGDRRRTGKTRDGRTLRVARPGHAT